MASELIKLPKERIRPIRRKNAGQVISWFAVSDNDLYINPNLIIEILAGFGIGPLGENIHKVRLSDKKELYIDDAGLDLLVPAEL